MKDSILNVAVVGGSGYTGQELLSLLLQHPQVSIQCVSSQQHAGRKIKEVYPRFAAHPGAQQCFVDTSEPLDYCQYDAVFFATPHGVAMQHVAACVEQNCRIIDLSADHRLKDIVQWQHWYKIEHCAPEYAKQAVYGLTEHARAEVAAAKIVANPGCYPTAIQLALLPLLKKGLLNLGAPLIIDAKSGTSGAGRTLAPHLLHAERSGNFTAYAVSGHRHQPEIEQALSQAAGCRVSLVFVPHLLPIARGLMASIYIRSTGADLEQLHRTLCDFYQQDCFVDVMPLGAYPDVNSVVGLNVCRIAVHPTCNSEIFVLLSVEDNLLKGASGQAVQNMNVMFGLEERLALPF